MLGGMQQSDAALYLPDHNSRACLASNLNGTSSRVASGQDWVHQQHMPLRNVPWQLLIDQLLLNNSVTNLAGAPAFAWGVPVQSIGCTVLGSWVMPALRTSCYVVMRLWNFATALQAGGGGGGGNCASFQDSTGQHSPALFKATMLRFLCRWLCSLTPMSLHGWQTAGSATCGPGSCQS